MNPCGQPTILPRMPSSGRRGVAMLMALATLVLVLAGVTAGLMAMRGARQSAWVSDVDGHLLAGLRQGERLALAWLDAGSAGIVLPPDGGGILLVDDRFLLPDGEGRLSVVAYDGLAGIPAYLAQRGSALRTSLPTALMGLVVPPINPTQPERSSWLIDCLDLPEGVTRFPSGLQGPGRVWRASGVSDPVREDSQAPPGPSLAETIAFRSDGRINLNTTPAPLLRTVYTALGLGGVEKVLERRRLLQDSQPPGNAPTAASRLRLVARSDRWQMLITVVWQGIHRSWWVDFTGTAQNFSMEQRHDVGP